MAANPAGCAEGQVTMIEAKFKLTKNGKCIGYMRIQREPVYRLRMLHEFRHPDSDGWVPAHILNLLPEADEIHPFVCRDCKDRDVYQGDSVRVRTILAGVFEATAGFASAIVVGGAVKCSMASVRKMELIEKEG